MRAFGRRGILKESTSRELTVLQQLGPVAFLLPRRRMSTMRVDLRRLHFFFLFFLFFLFFPFFPPPHEILNPVFALPVRLKCAGQ